MTGSRPAWLRTRFPADPRYHELRSLVRQLDLHTVCESAACPNIGECWTQGTATFLILGDRCTRRCGFCAVPGGRPDGPDPGEPARTAMAASSLGLKHVVVTSVTRDDLPDGGAAAFASTIREIRALCRETTVEVLIPDLGGDADSLGIVSDAAPDILAHNIETVERLTPIVRPQAGYKRSLEVLRRSKSSGKALIKSGLMVGLGETGEEIERSMVDLRDTGCGALTIGQYLRPSRSHMPVLRYYHPEEFEDLRSIAEGLGFSSVESAPLVRSSYHAADAAQRSLAKR